MRITPAIPHQIPASVELTDEEKKQIPPMYRMHHAPTLVERKILDMITNGMGADADADADDDLIGIYSRMLMEQ